MTFFRYETAGPSTYHLWPPWVFPPWPRISKRISLEKSTVNIASAIEAFESFANHTIYVDMCQGVRRGMQEGLHNERTQYGIPYRNTPSKTSALHRASLQLQSIHLMLGSPASPPHCTKASGECGERDQRLYVARSAPPSKPTQCHGSPLHLSLRRGESV